MLRHDLHPFNTKVFLEFFRFISYLFACISHYNVVGKDLEGLRSINERVEGTILHISSIFTGKEFMTKVS